MNPGGEEVGKIFYSASIDLAKLKDDVDKLKETVDKGAKNAASSFEKSLSGLESALRPVSIAAAATTAVIAAGFVSSTNAAWQQVRAVENASFGLRAYEKDASAVSSVLGELVEYARSDQGVLFQREELFQAASTLKGFGESTANLTDRVKLLAQGVAVGNTTFAELSQIIGRSAQQGKLTAEAYDQLAYRGIILDSSLRGAAVGADELYAALDGAIDDSILADRVNTIDGQMVRLQSAWRDLGSTILGVDRSTSQFIEGGLGSALRDGITSITNFIKENQRMIISVGSGIAVFAGMVAIAYPVVKGILAVTAAVRAMSAAALIGSGVFGVLAAVLGVIAGVAIGKVIDETLKATTATEDFAGTLSDATNQATGMSDATSKLAKDLAKINRDYDESLAEIVKRHQDAIKTITQQVEDENGKYNSAVQKRLATFQDEQGKEEEAHGLKTQKLQNQIDFLRKYNNQSNQQQLTELQFALSRENTAYDKRNAERQTKYDADADAERLSYEQRMLDLNTRLSAEQGVLDKHAGEVSRIRGMILLDEIEKLRRSRDEQIASAQESATKSVQAFGNQQGAAGTAGADLGNAMGASFSDAIKSALARTAWDILYWLRNRALELAKFVEFMFRAVGTENIYRLIKNKGDLSKTISDVWNSTMTPAGMAQGGSVSAGRPYFVGDNPDGSLNRTSELFVPKTSGTIIPAHEVQNAMGGSTGGNTTVNISLSGVMTSSPSDERAVAKRIVQRFNEVLQSQGKQPLGAV